MNSEKPAWRPPPAGAVGSACAVGVRYSFAGPFSNLELPRPWQRTHGLCLAVRKAAEQADVQQIAKRLETPSGLQRLRRLLRAALCKESTAAA